MTYHEFVLCGKFCFALGRDYGVETSYGLDFSAEPLNASGHRDRAGRQSRRGQGNATKSCCRLRFKIGLTSK